MEQINIDNIDIYEVEKGDYSSYFHRLPKNELMKTTPREGLVVYKDVVSGEAICGILTETIMGTNCNRFFIFNFMEEDRLGPEKVIKYITLPEEDYKYFLNLLPVKEYK